MLMQEPYMDFWKPNSEKIAQIKLQNVEDYEISVNGITGHNRAKEILRYDDKDELKGIEAVLKRDGVSNFLKADMGEYKNNVFYFKGNVKFQRDDLNFTSQSLKYDTENKVLTCQSPFTAWNLSTKINGAKFFYNINEKTLIVDKINATTNTEKK